MLLNSWVMARIPVSGSSCSTLPVMRSYPGDLAGRSWFRALLNGRTVVGGSPGEARAWRICWSSAGGTSGGEV